MTLNVTIFSIVTLHNDTWSNGIQHNATLQNDT